MVHKRFCLVLGALLAGCAPLQQAPLVYSSKVAVGVDVSAAVNETPGISVAIGYKQVDAAYVPVAVAKPCPDSETRCTSKQYDLVTLGGSSAVDSGNEASEANHAAATKLLEEVQKAAAAAAERKSAQQLAQQTFDSSDAALRRLRSELKALQDQSGQQANPASAEQVSRFAALTSFEIPTAEAKTKQAQADLAIAQAAAESAQKQVDSYKIDELARATRIVRGSDKKGDAHSVFGSFDGATRANVSAGADKTVDGGASLLVGKVFSTGIASQFLTQGLRDYYGNMSAERVAIKVVDCLTTVLKDAELKKDSAQRKVAMELCSLLRLQAKD